MPPPQEFGFDSSEYESGGGANTRNLRDSYNWTGLLMDGGHANPQINLHQEVITPANIVDLFRKYAVPREPDYVSIDLDTTDLWVLRALLASHIRPRVLSVEFNCVYGADAVFATWPNDPEARWTGTNTQGASLAAIEMVGREFGWSLAAVAPELDAFLVRDDLLRGAVKPQLADFHQLALCRSVLHGSPAAEDAARLLDYATWRRTGDEAAAAAALPGQLARLGINFARPGGRQTTACVCLPGSPA